MCSTRPFGDACLNNIVGKSCPEFIHSTIIEVYTAHCSKLLILVYHYTLFFTASDKKILNFPLKFLALSVVIVL